MAQGFSIVTAAMWLSRGGANVDHRGSGSLVSPPSN